MANERGKPMKDPPAASKVEQPDEWMRAALIEIRDATYSGTDEEELQQAINILAKQSKQSSQVRGNSMSEHYSKQTVSVSAYCRHCKKQTIHYGAPLGNSRFRSEDQLCLAGRVHVFRLAR